MERRTLGRSDLEVPVVALGSWLTYGDVVDGDRTRACVHRALDLGITFFDTADAYAGGAAEDALGAALAGVDRSGYVLASKVGLAVRDGTGLSGGHVAAQCEASLRRLRTDHLDVYQCHTWDRATPLDETMGALERLVEQGKVRWVGVSGWDARQLDAGCSAGGAAAPVAIQVERSILRRRPSAAVLPTCRERGVGLLAWSPLAQGVLTGKYAPGAAPPAGSRAADRAVSILRPYLRDEVLAAVRQLVPLAGDLGLTPGQLAVAWVLQEPAVAAAVVGARRPEQLDEVVPAVGARLDAATLAAIDAVVGPVLDRPAPAWRRAAVRVRAALPRR